MSDMIDALQELLRENPQDFETHFMLGQAYFDAADYARAVESLEAVIRLNPEFPAAYRWLGNSYEKLNRPHDAASIYRRGIDISERSGWLQPSKEMRVFLKRLLRENPESE